MIAILQRVKEASVTVDDTCVAKCDKGFLLLLGVAEGDEEKDAELLADKIAKLRVFEDENERMNLSITDVGARSSSYRILHSLLRIGRETDRTF